MDLIKHKQPPQLKEVPFFWEVFVFKEFANL